MIKILAIDDNQDNLVIIKALLKDVFPDALVFASLTGKQGLELAVAEDPDVILLDVVMPVMDGFEVCRRIKSDKRICEIPVVFLTATKRDKESRIHALECGAEAFISKPIDESELTAQIRAMLKIKKANIEKHIEKERLAELVEERTLELKNTHITTLNLLEDLRKENEARKKSEEILKEINEFNISLLKAIPFGMDIIDEDGHILFQSEIFTRMFGKEAIGKKCWKLYRDDKKQCIDCPLFKGINIGETDILESSGVLGGKIFEINHIGMMFNGKKAMLEIFQDITVRRQTEKRLLESYNLLNNLSDQVPGVVYQYRLYPDGRSAFPYSSQGMYEIYEVTSEEVREDASAVFYRIHPEDFDSVVETITESARNQTIYHSEFRVVLPEQGVRWRMCDARPHLLEDGSTLWYGIITDITEKKIMLQDLIQAKERAEESDNLKTSFLNNISHEIRTPFNGILGFLEIIQNGNITDNERDEYIDIINKSAYRLMNTINDIVEVSQIQAGQIILTPSQINMRNLVGELCDRFIADAESNNLEFILNYDLPGHIKFITTDRIKLYTILSIMISNALKFTKAGSVEFGIKLTNGPEDLNNDKTDRFKGLLVDNINEYIEFYVKDTGIGIPADKQQIIFERFRQADVSNTRDFEGSGLGLSIAKAYSDMLGGKIWAENNPEMISGQAGSVFHLAIPFNFKQEEIIVSSDIVADQARKVEVNSRVSGLKILIVEDDEGSALLLEMAVRFFTRELIKVTDGNKAIESCRNNPDIDLVLMDIKMPGMDGHEATRQIRQFNPNVVIIAQTAYAMTGDREKALKTGCNDYITKPINKDKLVELMKKYFGSVTFEAAGN